MRIVLAWGASSMSIRDVTTGLRGALLRAGHVVRDYRLDNRLELLARALPSEVDHRGYELSKLATESVLVEATYHDADLVLVVSGLLFHEIGLWLLARYQIPTAIVLTESPYQDDEQATWVRRYPDLTVCTQERTSAARFGWHYLPAAYDPDVHRPVDPDLDEACDVLLVGTGWPERQRVLEAVDWTGIHLILRGIWPDLTPDSPLFPFYRPGCVENGDLPRAYAATTIALNPYRHHATAESLNPRAYELAACGTFQLSDYRAESADLFGGTVPTYRDAAELEALIRYYLAHPDERRAKTDAARAVVQGQTFDRRVADLMTVLEPRALAAAG